MSKILRHGEGPPPQIVTTANGTVGLELALLALGLPPGSRVLVPAFTFIATAAAVVRAGLVPVFADVDPHTWLLSPSTAQAALNELPFDAVVPVAALGNPVDAAAWEAFALATGLPVVVDAAGAIGNQFVSRNVAYVFSTHATKTLCTGEGGCIASYDREFTHRTWRLSNFGIDHYSDEFLPQLGTNGKMSEYHAAVGLASLGRWEEACRRRSALAGEWLTHLATLPCRPQTRPADGIYSVLAVLLPGVRKEVIRRLRDAGIETRRWYCPTLPEHPAFTAAAKFGDLANTREIGEQLVGLPYHLQLKPGDISHITRILAGILTDTA